MIKTEKQDLELRLDVRYLAETYATGPKFDSPGLDGAFVPSYTLPNAKLANNLSFNPAFNLHSSHSAGLMQLTPIPELGE